MAKHGSHTAILVMFSLVVLSAIVSGQQQGEKPGACPPSVGIGICAFMCDGDQSCPGAEKCCRTGCGGTACTAPVSRLINAPKFKPGKCPEEPTGPWVCSHMCTSDADCRGRLKCCKNRCSALTCQKPLRE